MSIARHHAEWLSLVEVSGPFLSMPVLLKVLPQGLDAHDPDHVRSLRLAFEEWEENRDSARQKPALNDAWIRFVLGQTLGLPAEVLAEGQKIPQAIKATVSEHGETLRPDFVVRNPDGVPDAGKTRLLIQTYPASQNLDKPLAGLHWKASPATRMMELLHASDVRLGLVTNGDRWMLVDAPRGETTGFASWYASLWLEEQITLRAFRTLFGTHRFFAVPDNETLEAMLAESASNQQEVTDQLGYQVRRAVEVLIQSLDRADQDHGQELLVGLPETVLYEAALTVMMRLVFLFSAEERELLLLGDPLYDQHYSVSTLGEQLRETADQHGEEVLERRHDAWCRLLSTFRAVFGGVQHERLKLPAYAGNLFNPDRFPFLEGRQAKTSWRDTLANPLPVNNRTVLHLLEALQLLQVKVPGGGPAEARRLSFRALDIEQIGHVYEGLLDHTAKRATEPMLGLAGSRDKELEVALAELERLNAKGKDDLIAVLHEQTGRSTTALKKALEAKLEGDEASQCRAVCGNDEKLWQRVRPFAGLLREDTFGYPVVIRQGSVFVTAGTDRRSTGTHYTPRSLTEPIVQYTLEPLVYIGPAEGKPKEEWALRSAREILSLKVCDMACGSGAFLVQACRYLADRLMEAWEDAEKQAGAEQSDLFPSGSQKASGGPAPYITPYGMPSKGGLYEDLIPRETDVRLAYALPLVAQRCLYGVDKNPLAVEMAKLSLWLLTLAKDRPFTFLDHAIRGGDSLVGITDLRQIEVFNLACEGDGYPLILDFLKQRIKRAVELRRKLEEMPVKTVEDVQAQERLFAECQELLDRAKVAADWLIAVEFQGGSSSDRDARRVHAAMQVAGHFDDPDFATFEREARKRLNGQATFHWPLEFPEVMVPRKGFDAFVCNPPFMGGKKITGNLGDEYRDYLVNTLAGGAKGHADLCAYFFLRATFLLRDTGGLGFLATNTIAQGDTREVGLDRIVDGDCTITRAVPSRKWPGTANLEVAHVWVRRNPWAGSFVLEEKPVPGITSFLAVPGAVSGKPYRLVANAEKSFIGSYVLGMGFVLEPEEAEGLIRKISRNRDVLFPYLNGEDLNSRPDQSASRWVINFFDWPLDRKTAPTGYEGPVAADYPDCLAIVEEKVKPERTRRNEKGEFALRKPLPQKWWIYADKRPALYSTIAGMDRVLVTARVSKFVSLVHSPATIVSSEQIVVIADPGWAMFGMCQSAAHECWVQALQSSLETRGRYTPSDCFETFPFPDRLMGLAAVGERYHEHRRKIMLNRQEGLTKTYNHFHDPDETADDIRKLRELHVEMDKAVTAAYGWTDLDLGHGFHKTKQGLRFTISEAARREVLGRLLKLNHERYAEEVAKGLHDKKGKGKGPGVGRSRKLARRQTTDAPLFGDEKGAGPPQEVVEEFEAALEEEAQAWMAAALEAFRAKDDPQADDEPDGGRQGEIKTKSDAERPPPIDELDSNEAMAAFRQAARGRGWLERNELLKEVSTVLGYQRLGPKIEEALRGHLRAAIRRKIIESEGELLRACTATMEEYELEELRGTLCSVMRAGSKHEREEVIRAVASYLGFARVTDTVRHSIKSAINSGIRQGILGYEGSVVWRET
jgi:hypothetical protein